MEALAELQSNGGTDDAAHKVNPIQRPRPAVPLSFVVTAEFRDFLDQLARDLNEDQLEVIRLGLGLLRIGADARAEGNRLAIVTPDNEVDQEVEF